MSNSTDNINDFVKIINNLIQKETGIILKDERLIDLEIVLKSRLTKLMMSQEDYVKYFSYSHDEIILVASQFTIQESSFYRYKAHYDRIKEKLLPQIYKTNKEKITILSAGCATGEEPYTLAMIIEDFIQNHPIKEISIIATDISAKAISFAQNGIYSKYKLRNIDSYYRKKYFKKKMIDNRPSYLVKENLKKHINFIHRNLISEPFSLSNLSEIDIILCENVIIYFQRNSIERLINNFYNILKPGGFLFLGYSETLNFINHKFSLSWWKDSYAYCKDEKKQITMEHTETNYNQEIKSPNFDTLDKDNILDFCIDNCVNDMTADCTEVFHKIKNLNLEDDWRFLLLKAEMQFKKKNYLNAASEVRKAISLSPYLLDGHIFLAIIYLQLKMLKNADFEIKTARYIKSNSPIVHYLRAVYAHLSFDEMKANNYIQKAHTYLMDNKGEFYTLLFPTNIKIKEIIYRSLVMQEINLLEGM